jgi:hypothetical protein
MPWHVWEDPNEEEKPVYAMFRSREGSDGFTKLWKLGSGGRVHEMPAGAFVPGHTEPDLVTELGSLGEPAGLSLRQDRALAYRDGVYVLIQRDDSSDPDVMQLWRIDTGGDTWEEILEYPKGLVRTIDNRLAVLHPSMMP